MDPEKESRYIIREIIAYWEGNTDGVMFRCTWNQDKGTWTISVKVVSEFSGSVLVKRELGRDQWAADDRLRYIMRLGEILHGNLRQRGVFV